MLLGDVGGLYGLLFSVLASLNAIFSFNKPKNLLVQSLYKGDDNQNDLRRDLLYASKQYATKEYLQATLPSFCSNLCNCLKPSKKDKLFAKSRERL